jgi:hypothetical protein
MVLYITTTSQVVSTVLVIEREGAGKIHGAQRPIYYLSKVLTPAKQRYPHHQKLAYVVWMIARKLSALLCGAPDHRLHGSTAEEHTHQPRCYRSSIPVGHRVGSTRHLLRQSNILQVTGPPGLLRRLDPIANTGCS